MSVSASSTSATTSSSSSSSSSSSLAFAHGDVIVPVSAVPGLCAPVVGKKKKLRKFLCFCKKKTNKQNQLFARVCVPCLVCLLVCVCMCVCRFFLRGNHRRKSRLAIVSLYLSSPIIDRSSFLITIFFGNNDVDDVDLLANS